MNRSHQFAPNMFEAPGAGESVQYLLQLLTRRFVCCEPQDKAQLIDQEWRNQRTVPGETCVQATEQVFALNFIRKLEEGSFAKETHIAVAHG